ncbi:hypothetical protein QIS99_03605 [Streptomyces sp. B-S-A8]|uniref:Uncharacterized protein n=1 Tax=Streptomyces solicavernae TaxID=3043614 RepID=A0ABT6RLY6_9ACTN|nr:hypothetical protein [Streptomyces sp. B-S-A8]MDI3385305.1 hypothetical protein [Streptomyces sp. B-S-A8]
MHPANATGPDGATLRYGNPDNARTLDLFLELRDRSSRYAMDGLLSTMRQAADEGRFVLHFHFAALLDGTVGGSGSVRALSALGAAGDVGQRQFADYLAALFAGQPFPPGFDRFSDPAVLLSLAGKVDGLRSPEFDGKVTAHTYVHWAGEATGAFGAYGVLETPAARLDGEELTLVRAEGGFARGAAISVQEFLEQIPQ